MAEDNKHEVRDLSEAIPKGQSRDAEPSRSQTPAAFSMAHALNIIRRRQEEQRRALEEQEKQVEEERKEKTREKRRRRRRNQKDRKVKSRTEANDETGDGASSGVGANSDRNLDVDMDGDDDDGSNSRPGNLKRSADDDLHEGSVDNEARESVPQTSLPMKKRLKLKHDTSVKREAAEAEARQNSTRLKSFIPRALLLKKKKPEQS